MERKVGVFVCCLLAVAAGALPAMGNGMFDSWEGPMTVMYHVTSEPGEGVLVEQWANQHLAQATPFDGDGTATWQFVGYYPIAVGGYCLSGAPMWLHAPLVVPSGDGALIFHHWDDHDPGVNTAYYQFCLSGEVTAHYQFLSSGALLRTLHVSLVCPDAQCNCYHPDVSVSAQADPPDYYGISSRSMAYGGADFLYLGNRTSATVSVPYAMQSPEGKGLRFGHWGGLPPGSLVSGPLNSTAKLELLQNAEIAVVYIAPSAAVVADKTSFPTAMVPGRWYQATVTMKNTGTDTWTKADGYGLVCLDSPPDLWTTTQVPLDDGDAIAPGQERTFRFVMRAPQPGSYLPQWSMAIGDVAFGETTSTQSVSVTADAGTGFPDVPVGYWAYDGVMACSKANIVGGYADSLYHPELSVTRDQMAVYIARALVSPSGDAAIADPGPPPSFSDVPPDYWAYKQIEYAVSQNVVEGYDDGTYQPGAMADRGQMAVYLARAMVAPGGDAAIPDPVPPATFPDVPDTHWAYKHIEYCFEHGVVEGYDDGYYHPEIVVTRDQMAVYIARAFGLL